MKFVTTKNIVMSLSLVSTLIGCKARNATSSDTKMSTADLSQATAQQQTLNRVKSLIAKTRFNLPNDKDVKAQRMAVYQLTLDIQGELERYSASAIKSDPADVFGLYGAPNFYSLVSAPDFQLFDMLNMAVPQVSKSTKPTERLTAEQYLQGPFEGPQYNAVPTYANIGDPAVALNEIDKTAPSLVPKIADLITSFERNYKPHPPLDPKFMQKSPADKLDVLQADLTHFFDANNPVALPITETGKRQMILISAQRIRDAFVKSQEVIGNNYPNFYAQVYITPQKQLFDILGHGFPTQCDPNRTEPNKLRTPEEFLQSGGSYDVIGDSAQAYHAMKLGAVNVLSQLKLKVRSDKAEKSFNGQNP